MNRPLIVIFTRCDQETKSGYLNRLLGEQVAQWLWADDEDPRPVLIAGSGCRIYDAARETPQDRTDVVLLKDRSYDEAGDAKWIRDIATPMFNESDAPNRSLGVVQHASSKSHKKQLEMLGAAMGERSPDRTQYAPHSYGAVYDQLGAIAVALDKRSRAEYEEAVQQLAELVLGNPHLEAKLDLLHACLPVWVRDPDFSDPADVKRILDAVTEPEVSRRARHVLGSADMTETSSTSEAGVPARSPAPDHLARLRDDLLGAEP